jgi:hypothetical protein
LAGLAHVIVNAPIILILKLEITMLYMYIILYVVYKMIYIAYIVYGPNMVYGAIY